MIGLGEEDFGSRETKRILTKRSYRIDVLGFGAPKLKVGALDTIGSKH